MGWWASAAKWAGRALGIDLLASAGKKAWQFFEEPVTILIKGKRWWVVGPQGAGKTTFHEFLRRDDVPNDHVESYSPTMQQVDVKKGRNESIGSIVKKTVDMGGHRQFWELWEKSLNQGPFHRLAFILDLENVKPGTACEKVTVIETAFEFACTALEEAWRRAKPKHKATKILVFANKADLWGVASNGTEPDVFKFVRERLEPRAKLLNERTSLQPIWIWGALLNDSRWSGRLRDTIRRLE